MRFKINILQFSTFPSNKYLLLFLLFFALKGTNAQTISSTTVNNTHFCLGGTYTVTFTTTGTTGSIFTVQLSNNTGSFSTFTNLDSNSTNSISITIPLAASLSNNYKIRVVRRVGPAIFGDTLSNLTITRPSPSFSFTNYTCAGTNVSFTNSSTGNGVGIANYSWNFSATAGAPSSPNTNANPTVFFNPANGSGTINYNVILTATDSFACTNTVNNTVSIRQKPTPAFTFNNNACAGSNVSFSNGSSGAPTLSFSWDFSGTAGAPSSPNTNASPTVQFNPAVGGGTITYSTTLTVTDGYGCVSSLSSNVIIKRKPDFYLDTNVVQSTNGVEWDPVLKLFSNCTASQTNPTFTFTDSISSSTYLSNTNIVINWGDATSTTYTSPFLQSKFISHIYNTLGYFNFNITINNSNGCANTINYNSYNGYLPKGGINNPGYLPQYCNPVTLPFPVDTSNTNENPPGTLYVFTVNDSSAAQTFNQSNLPAVIYHTFTKTSCGTTSYNGSTPYPNGFQASMNITNPCGAAGNSQTPFRIIRKIVADFTPSSTLICNNNPITFTNTSTGNYFTSTGSNCLTILNKLWSITPTTGWTLTSGAMSPAAIGNNIVVVNFNTPGTYQIRLIASQPSNPTLGCSADTIIKTICVQPVPAPNFTFTNSPSNRCTNSTLSITNTSNTLTSCGITTYNWIILDSLNSNAVVSPGARFSYVSPSTANFINPVFLFTQSGIYKIRLQITNVCGMVAKDTFIIIKDKPIVSLPSAKAYCDAQSIIFSSANVNHNPTINPNYGTISAYSWSISPSGSTFTTGTASSSNPTISFPNTTTLPITYTVTLTATNECGVSNSATQNITIYPKPIVTATSSPANTTFCSGGSTNIVLTNNLPTGSGVTYTWRATASSINISGHLSQSSGTTGPIVQQLFNAGSTIETVTYRIVGQSSVGCLGDSVTLVITVKPIPRVIATSQIICSGSTTNLVLSSNVISTLFTWTAATTGTTTGFRDTSIAVSGPIVQTLTNTSNISNDVNYSIKAIANGCSSLDTIIRVTVKPIPQLSNATLTQIICSGDTARFTPTSFVSGTIFNYTTSTQSGVATGQTSSGSGNVLQRLFNAGSIPAIVRYSYTPSSGGTPNCIGSAVNFEVTVKPIPIATANPTAAFLCSGAQTNIVLTPTIAGTLYTWTAVLTSGTATTGFSSNATPNAGPIAQAITNSSTSNSIITYTITPTLNGCVGTSFTSVITVYPGTTPGTVGSAATVCSGNNSGTLNLTGNTGNVVKWESSVSPFSTWDSIYNTTTSLTYTNLTQSKRYRAVVQSGTVGSCSQVATNWVQITVDSITIAGNLIGTDTVCTGINTGIITLLNKRGSIVNWDSSTALSTWYPISTSANINPYTYRNLTQTTWYRVKVKNGVCPFVNSDSVRIQVDALPSAANAPNRTACANSISVGLADSLIANPISTSIGLWTYISGPNTPTIVSPNATTSLINNMAIGIHLIQWKVSNGKCPANKDTLYFTVYAPLYDSIASNQTICSGQTSSQITTITTSGGNGNYTFQWQSSPNGSSSWTNISGATSASYSPGSPNCNYLL